VKISYSIVTIKCGDKITFVLQEMNNIGRHLQFIAVILTLAIISGTSMADDDLQRGAFRESATVVAVAGDEWANRFRSMVDPDKTVRWSIFVPESYDPESPAGLMIYISPSNSGKIPRAWQSVMSEQNLIWISADRSGNSVDPRARMAYSLLAPMHIGKSYNIDGQRIYLSGLSGGGRVASLVAPEYPQLFRGAIFICGTNKWENHTPQKVAALNSSRLVFLTGSEDFNRRETRRAHAEYENLGFEYGLYLEIPNMGHQNPTAKNFAKAIAYLDNR